MACITKTIVRIGLIGTLAAGGVMVVAANSPRARALLSQAQNNISQAIDSNIDDPIALRAKLRDLVAHNPKRINDVRSDLAELDQQIAEFDREMAVSKRVVELAEADLSTLDSMLTRATQARTENAGYKVVRVRFGDNSLTVDEAYAKAQHITNQRNAYAKRTNEMNQNLGYLAKQRTQLAQLLIKLEAEQSQLQAELWLLDRDVDTIARNERLVEMMQKRQETIDRNSRYSGTSLENYKNQVARIKAKQERTLALLTQNAVEDNYVSRAEFDLDRDHSARSIYEKDSELKLIPLQTKPSVLEITPDDEAEEHTSPMASRID